MYLDPPFNSQATYNVVFRSFFDEKSKAQIEAFENPCHWSDEAELAFDGLMAGGSRTMATFKYFPSSSGRERYRRDEYLS